MPAVLHGEQIEGELHLLDRPDALERLSRRIEHRRERCDLLGVVQRVEAEVRDQLCALCERRECELDEAALVAAPAPAVARTVEGERRVAAGDLCDQPWLLRDAARDGQLGQRAQQ